LIVFAGLWRKVMPLRLCFDNSVAADAYRLIGALPIALRLAVAFQRNRMADKDLRTSLAPIPVLHSANNSPPVDGTSPDRTLVIRLMANGEVPFDVEMPEPLRSELAGEVREERKRQLIRLIARLMAQSLHAARREMESSS